MTGRWWECKVCAEDLGVFGELVMEHRERTGHAGASLLHGERRVLDRPMPVPVRKRTTRYTVDGDPL